MPLNKETKPNKPLQNQVTLFNTYNLQLYGIKYFHRIQIIFRQIHLTHG